MANIPLPWLVCLIIICGASSAAIRGLRIPAESATGRYLSSGVVQRSVMPPVIASSLSGETMQGDDPDIGGIGPNEVGSQGGHWLGLGKRAHDNDDLDDSSRFTPYVSVGVLSNMQQFFDSLRNNLDSLEELPVEEKDLLLGRAPSNGETSKHTAPASHNTRRLVTEHRSSRPTATAAYLHALRSHRPSHKLRNFVAQVEPSDLRGSNTYDPAWLWAGLGRRRR